MIVSQTSTGPEDEQPTCQQWFTSDRVRKFVYSQGRLDPLWVRSARQQARTRVEVRNYLAPIIGQSHSAAVFGWPRLVRIADYAECAKGLANFR